MRGLSEPRDSHIRAPSSPRNKRKSFFGVLIRRRSFSFEDEKSRWAVENVGEETFLIRKTKTMFVLNDGTSAFACLSGFVSRWSYRFGRLICNLGTFFSDDWEPKTLLSLRSSSRKYSSINPLGGSILFQSWMITWVSTLIAMKLIVICFLVWNLGTVIAQREIFGNLNCKDKNKNLWVNFQLKGQVQHSNFFLNW